MMWRSRKARLRDEALLVAFAERLCEVSALTEPRAQFRDSLRTTLIMEGSTALMARPVTSGTPATHARRVLPRRRLALATALVASTLGMGGMASASASALPGDTLYPVKRGIEGVELALKRGDADRGAFRLELAAERLAETSELAQRRDVADTLKAHTLTEYNQQAEDGSEALLLSFKATSDHANIVTLNRFAAAAYDRLTALEGRLSGAAATALESAREQLSSIVEMSVRLCPNCGGIDSGLISALQATQAAEVDDSEPDAAEPSAPDDPAPTAPNPLPPSAGTTERGATSEQKNESASDDDQDEEESTDDELTDDALQPADRIPLSPLPPLPNVMTPGPGPLPTLAPSPTLPTPTLPTPTPTPSPVPSPTPTCHLNNGNGNSCNPTPPGLGLGLGLEKGTPPVDQQLVQGLLDGLADLIGDVE